MPCGIATWREDLAQSNLQVSSVTATAASLLAAHDLSADLAMPTGFGGDIDVLAAGRQIGRFVVAGHR